MLVLLNYQGEGRFFRAESSLDFFSPYTEQLVEPAFGVAFDANGDGRLSLEEFRQMMERK